MLEGVSNRASNVAKEELTNKLNKLKQTKGSGSLCNPWSSLPKDRVDAKS